tara:strand:- start:21 stop:1244 length:1224 start_codon:yes stop_codon:yes gene_type:complete
MSIFSKPTPPPTEKINEKRFADVELSISKRYSALEKKIDNLFDGLSNRLSKFDEQVNILLKRTYDLERKVEGQLIDVENTAKKQLHHQLDRMEQFEKRISKSYITTKEHRDISDDIAGTIRSVKTEMDGISDETKRIEKSIPRDTASTTSISKIKAELDVKISKIANAIPKNTVSGDTLTGVRQELINQMQTYATTEALNAVSNITKKLSSDNIESNNLISKSVTKHQRDLGLMKEIINNIQKDYLDSDFNKTVDSKILNNSKELVQLIKDTNKAIPTDTVSGNEFKSLLEKQKQLNTLVDKNKISSSESLDVVDKSITGKVNKSVSKVNKDIQSIKKTIIELKLGSDTSGLKLMVRELVDDVIKDIKNTNDFALENFKVENVDRRKEIKKINKDINQIITLIQRKK